MKVIKSNKSKKRFMAVFKDGDKVYFGQPNPKSGTYIDLKDKIERLNYIKRHSNEKPFYNDLKRQATLSLLLVGVLKLI